LSKTYIEVTESIINKIKKIEDIKRVQLKPLILELANHFALGIETKRPEIINKLKQILAQDTEKPRGQEDISVKLVAQLIKKIKTQHFPSVSDNWIMKVLPKEFKEDARNKPVEKVILSEHITDENLYRIKDILKGRIRVMETVGPSKEIKIKETVKDVSNYTWKCATAQELARLAIKMEQEHPTEHDNNYCLKSSRAIKMARDGRFATTMSRYEAIVVGAEHTKSLANVAEGEYEFLKRWEVEGNEKACTECLSRDNCAATQCNHVCHAIVKPLTTKGVKWAIRTNKDLADLQTRIKKLQVDTDDLCPMMKTIFTNPYMNKKLTMGDKKTLMAKHTELAAHGGDECDQCVGFIAIHPNFYREHLE